MKLLLDQTDPRARRAWRSWLQSLASDAEAAVAAAHLYGELAVEGREAWLTALEEDVAHLDVPALAAYGPLLAVETDPGRRARIEAAVGGGLSSIQRVTRALLGGGQSGDRIAVLVVPLYLDFVRALICRYRPAVGFRWVRQEPILRAAEAPTSGDEVEGVSLKSSRLEDVIDELAHAILAHRRGGAPMEEALEGWADLFSVQAVSLARESVYP